MVDVEQWGVGCTHDRLVAVKGSRADAEAACKDPRFDRLVRSPDGGRTWVEVDDAQRTPAPGGGSIPSSTSKGDV